MGDDSQNRPAILAAAFGAVLRDVRKERGLSQEDLGFESGYHRTYVSLLERGLKSPSLQTLALPDALSYQASCPQYSVWLEPCFAAVP